MTNSSNKFDLDSNLVRKLAKLLQETGLSEIEYAEGDRSIRVARAAAPAAPIQFAAAPATAPAEPVSAAAHPGAVISPMVGTAYLQAEPGSPPFASVGSPVRVGDTLLIIEAMKVMNPIKAPSAGTIADILVGDSKPVEFGETLIVIA